MQWHRGFWTAVVVLVSGCGFEFKPITDAQVKELGITEGLAGNAAKHVGDCMPGPVVKSSCQYEPLDADLWIVPQSKVASLPAATQGSECRLQLANVTPASLEAVVKSLDSGRYGATLAPGTYMPLIVEPNGCGNCPGMTNGEPCPTVEVVAGQVTKADAVLDRASY